MAWWNSFWMVKGSRKFHVEGYFWFELSLYHLRVSCHSTLSSRLLRGRRYHSYTLPKHITPSSRYYLSCLAHALQRSPILLWTEQSNEWFRSWADWLWKVANSSSSGDCLKDFPEATWDFTHFSGFSKSRAKEAIKCLRLVCIPVVEDAFKRAWMEEFEFLRWRHQYA